MKSTKALVLFSGGLDSILAARTLLEQGVEVTALCFTSAFYNCEKALKSSQELGIKCLVEDISADMLSLVKDPPSGYGKNLNPCIDCHSMMVRKAAEIMRKDKYDLIATGEVLGQRPFSQNRDALKRVEDLSGTEVLRPLSAKLLEETTAEKKGFITRGRLHAIQGRTRAGQEELIIKYRIKDYPSPAGGCLLTDPGYSERLMKLLEFWPECDTDDAELLKHGRIFWLQQEKDRGHVLLMVGRHQKDNETLLKIKKDGDILMDIKDINGPTTLLRTYKEKIVMNNNEIKVEIPNDLKFSELKLNEARNDAEIIAVAGLLTGHYATKARGLSIKCRIMV